MSWSLSLLTSANFLGLCNDDISLNRLRLHIYADPPIKYDRICETVGDTTFALNSALQLLVTRRYINGRTRQLAEVEVHPTQIYISILRLPWLTLPPLTFEVCVLFRFLHRLRNGKISII